MLILMVPIRRIKFLLRLLVVFVFLVPVNVLIHAQDYALNHSISRVNSTYKPSLDIPSIPLNPSKAFFGSRMQRTLSLLSTSSELHRNKIRILFYGQSIVQGLDTQSMIEHLETMYPNAIIEYENRAIGGFQAPNLVRTAIHDLYPYYPDLLIFHVYGGEETGDLERIIYNTRKYTTSDILLFNHHFSWETDPEKLDERIKRDDLSSEYWRYLAQKYGCELVDVRNSWKLYLNAHPQININSLMGDTVHSNVHPNKKGNKLLECLILEHFEPNHHRQYLPYSGWNSIVRDYEIKRSFVEEKDEITFTGEATVTDNGVRLDEGTLNLIFSGNRVLLNGITGKDKNGKIEVLIDGQPPSKNPDLYYATRPSKAYSHWRPALKRVSLGKDPLIEKWTLTITSIDRGSGLIEYDLHGSSSGFDGSGDNRNNFISNSGRIIIEASDFFIFESEAYTKKPTPVGFEIEWEIKPLFIDTISVETNNVSSYTIAQGLTNEKHELKLIITENVELRSITVHTPPLK